MSWTSLLVVSGIILYSSKSFQQAIISVDIENANKIELVNYSGGSEEFKSNVLYVIYNANFCEHCVSPDMAEKNQVVFLIQFDRNKLTNLKSKSYLSKKYNCDVLFIKKKVLSLPEINFNFESDIGPIYFMVN